MKTTHGGLEFKEAHACMDLKNTTAIITVICNMMLFPKIEMRKNVSDAQLIKIHFDVAEIRLLRGELGTLVAVYTDGIGSGTNVGDMLGCVFLQES